MTRARMCSIRAITVVMVLCGCDAEEPPPPPPVETPDLIEAGLSETELRARLGVPDGAEQVMVLSQSSHLDIDWRSTFEEYYAERVERILDEATEWLGEEPLAFYSVAEMGFLERYTDERGRDTSRTQAESGQLRIVGGGVTTPDTLLPTTEALVHDYLLGTRYAEDVMGARVQAAWLPDSFGHSPALPDLLSAMGFTSVGFSRVDGGRHPYEILFSGLDPIAEGADSTAAMLLEMGSADFVWRGPGGATVLAHYMPVDLYCQGDTIDLDGLPLNGERLGRNQSGDPTFTNGRIAEYADQLAPYTRTPYMFVPVGCDFQPPRPQLVEYASRWNDARFAESGLWVVVATFEDYMRLVSFHRAELPEIERDINPYWTGFYGTRIGVKRRARVAGESLAGLEPFLGGVGGDTSTLDGAWRAVAFSNHHDFITGTANDRVVFDEQVPMLDAAIANGEQGWDRALSSLEEMVDTRGLSAESFLVVNSSPTDHTGIVEVETTLAGDVHVEADGAAMMPAQVVDGTATFVADAVPGLGWRTFSLVAGPVAGASVTVGADTTVIDTGRSIATLGRDAEGWALTGLLVDGTELLAGPSLTWSVMADSGGLYRIGTERPDCEDASFALQRSLRSDTLEVLETGPARVTIRLTATLDDSVFTMDLIGVAGADQLVIRATGASPRESTTLLDARLAGVAEALTMSVPGGVAERPLRHLYDPSFWPAVRWVRYRGATVLLGQSTGVRATADGLAWMAFRNATTEMPCDDVGPAGTDDAPSEVLFALGGALDDVDAFRRSIALDRPMRARRVSEHDGPLEATDRWLRVEGDSVLVSSLEPARRGEGWIVGLRRYGETADAVVHPGALTWSSALSTDLLQRDDDRSLDSAPPLTVRVDEVFRTVRLVP